MSELPPGLYERLITATLKAKLLQFDPARTRVREQDLDQAEAHAVLAQHLGEVVARALRDVPPHDRLEKQREITNNLLSLLEQGAEVVTDPPRVLQAIQPLTGIPAQDTEITAPLVSLADSDLLVNARGEPTLAHALAHEIPSADSIDLLCAFVRWHGLRVLEDQLVAHCRAKKILRVITTVYTGSTERKALDWLVSLGAQVKVSYDTQSTRLHAKAWMFRRATGYTTAYIGSSNLSKSALIDGVEWNVRLSQVGSPDILEKFDGTFENYWQSPEYETYEPSRDANRFDRAVASDGPTLQDDGFLSFLDVEPWPHQREILENLAVERHRHHRFKNLVVAATGTGKTIVSALDFKRLRTSMGDPTLLFVAHRQEILKQSVGAFRQVLKDGGFGELYVDGHRPDEWRHVFASIQSLAQVNIDRIDPAAFDVVVVDEFHHAAAPTYRKVLERLKPKVLLGLTATPERTDANDILHYFDGHIAAELRLWDALERGLLCPLQYFGLHDNADLSQVTWSRKGYDVSELENLYTADDARVRLILEQLSAKHRDARTMKALGFCVSIAHAEFMARKFNESGLPSRAVSADTDRDARKTAVADLRAGRLRALFAVDLLNEGVDLPEVDTLLFLRPTESALVFMQQLGRGLRRSESKDCVSVFDFIGQAHRQFRFDLRYRAITGGTRSEVERQIELGFPFLPAGCSMQLDKVASKIVLENLRRAIPNARPAMVRELRTMMESELYRQQPPTLTEFLNETGLDLADIYKNGCWSQLQRAAGVTMPAPGPQEQSIGDAIGRVLHVDDPLRLDAYRTWLRGGDANPRLITALLYSLWNSGSAPATLDDARTTLVAHPALVSEVLELLQLLEDRAEHLTYPLATDPEDPALKGASQLSVHARHSLVDIFSAIGRITPGHFYQHREGVYFDEATNTDLFFVTLKKSDREYSKSTLYKDYAISPTLFHWESQSTTTVRSRTAQRYIHHRERRGQILLFVRQQKKLDGQTVPYTLLGPAEYVSHQNERPIQFTLRLQRPMPADFFRQSKIAAG